MAEHISPEVRFNRFVRLVGSDGLARMQHAFVVVVGVGAVGSFAVEALARCGVGRLRLVDFDTVQPSNINRQLMAMESTIGLKKVDVARARVLDINPECVVEPMDMMVGAERVPFGEGELPDVVVDAIDLLSGKIALWVEAIKQRIPIVSSMGAARRKDPTLVRTGKFCHVTGCPLAKCLRRELKAIGLEQASAEVPCVYSMEKAISLPVEHEQRDDGVHSKTPTKQPLPSSMMVTGCFGLNLANLVIKHIASSAK